MIQAVLGGEYFNENATYFLFTIGDNRQTNYNGNSYINFPLSAGTSYELSYYILFYDENEVSEDNIVMNLTNIAIYAIFPFRVYPS